MAKQWVNLAGGHERAMLNVVRLLETRLLVQANSGGGKSWLLRKLLEETAPFVQWIVIDPEGEFRTLREEVDCVIAAPTDGDVVAHPATAALLARRLLETQLPAVVDIYELKAHERILFVRRFCEALVDAPKALWHPVLVVLDEAHVFAPQVGDAESRGAVIDLATRGRKRGFALCAATQRLSKLHKDVAAELLNKLIGRTGLDVDVKRAADELGFDKERGRELRPLRPGRFFMFGPAFETEQVALASIGSVRTTHPKAGHRLMVAPPKPSKKILAVLGKELADLPKQVAQQARTETEYLKTIARLKSELQSANAIVRSLGSAKPAPKIDVARIELAASVKVAKEFEQRLQPYQRMLTSFIKHADTLKEMGATVGGRAQELLKAMEARPTAKQIKAMQWTPKQLEEIKTMEASPYPVKMHALKEASRRMQAAPVRPTIVRANGEDHDVPLRKGALSILSELVARQPAGYTRSQVATLVGMAPSGGTYLTYLSDLRRTGCVEERDGMLYATQAGVDRVGGEIPSPKTHEEVMSVWGKALRKGAFNMLEHVVSCNAHGTTRDELAEFMSMAPKGGTYLTYLSDLRRNGLIVERDGAIHAAPILFPENV